MSARDVLLVGSVPLENAEAVFAAAASQLGPLARCIPDGETGDRLKWIGWQSDHLRKLPDLQVVAEFQVGGNVAQSMGVFAPQDGVDLASLDLSPLGYADAARSSYADFQRLRGEGVIPPGVRFQVSMPAPLDVAILFAERVPEILPALERAFRSEVAQIVASIPHDDLAIQWDLAIETQLEEARRHPENDRMPQRGETPPMEVTVAAVKRVSDDIPPDVWLGIHLCYGDPDGGHLIDPVDLSVCVDLSNHLSAAIARRIDWIHMPVPIDRDDDAYFVPLDGLRLAPQTRVYLGLVHLADGEAGAQRRVDAAMAHLQEFGVAFECGLGRRDPQAITELLDLHRVVAETM